MDTSDRTILKRLILGLVLIVLVGVVVWVFFVRDDKKNTSTTGGNGSKTTQTNGTANGQSNGQAQAQAQGAQQGPQAAGGTAQSGGSANGGGQPQTLAATGPEGAAVVFAGAAVAGTVGHHLYRAYRRKRAV